MSEIPVIQVDTSSGRSSVAPREWWADEYKTERAKSVFAVALQIEKSLRYRRQENLRYAKLYANKDFTDYLSAITCDYLGARMSLNVCKAVSDTATAKIAKDKTRVMWLTGDGDLSKKRRAKGLTRFNDGMFYEQRAYEKGRQVFLDACVFGTGVVKVYTRKGKVYTERVLIDELLIDESEGRYGDPRQVHQVKAVDMHVLMAQYPDFKQEIATAERVRVVNNDSVGSLVRVIESWHLPSGKGADDGFHCISISNAVLVEEKYTKDYFPFVFFRWSEPLVGFYGESLIGEIIGVQVEINEMVLRIQEAMSLMSVPRIFVERGSKVNVDHLNDEIGAVIEYSGTAPEAKVWQAMSQEVYMYLEYLYNKAFAIPGISQLSATSKKPAGLDSAVALREYQDIETERFSVVALRFQQFYIDLGVHYARLADEVSTEKRPLEVKAPGKGGMDVIKWSDVKDDLDSFVLKAYPTSVLPATPEGQLASIQEMLQAGILPKEYALGLLDFPDLQQWINIQTAGVDDILYIAERIIEHGEYVAPEPYMDLTNGIKIMQSAYIRSRSTGLEEDRRDLLRNWIDEAVGLLTVEPEQPAPVMPVAAPGAPSAAPIAIPEPPPTSELMPIAQ